jgi:phage regulator Rha-like protein
MAKRTSGRKHPQPVIASFDEGPATFQPCPLLRLHRGPGLESLNKNTALSFKGSYVGARQEVAKQPALGLTMSSREIADLCEARHNDVVATIDRLFENGVLRESRKTLRAFSPEGGGRPTQVYDLTKRDTFVVVSGYSAELRARIIDRWMELEAALQAPRPFDAGYPQHVGRIGKSRG